MKHRILQHIPIPRAAGILLVTLSLGALPSIKVRAQTQDPSSVTAAPARTPPVPIQATDPAAALLTAKISEEGDQDFERASREYNALIEQYDALRPRVAEALFRYAEVARKRGRTQDAVEAYNRIAHEFQAVGHFAARSQERLVEIQPATAGPVAFSMPPELRRRYGLTAQGSTAQSGSGGSTASWPGPAGSAGSAARYGHPPSAGGPLTPGTFPAQAPSPARPSASTAAPSEELNTLRAEAAEITSRLRKLRRERRAAEVTLRDFLSKTYRPRLAATEEKLEIERKILAEEMASARAGSQSTH